MAVEYIATSSADRGEEVFWRLTGLYCWFFLLSRSLFFILVKNSVNRLTVNAMTIANPPITAQDLFAIGVSDLFGQHIRNNDFAKARRVSGDHKAIITGDNRRIENTVQFKKARRPSEH
jgi:hypothetical protein